MTVKEKIARRNLIIFGEEEIVYSDGLKYFGNLYRDKLIQLIKKQIFDPFPLSRYMEFVWFMIEYGHSDFCLNGHVYSPERMFRSDRQCGIVLEGIGSDKKWSEYNKEVKMVFGFLFGSADEFELNPPWAWYD